MRMILSVLAIILLIVPVVAPAADFSGDGTDDITIFRPSTGLWAVRGFTRVYFGTWNDEPAPGNYNGAPGDEFAIYRATSGLWAIRGMTRAYFGGAGDIPISAGGDADWYRSGTNLCALAAGYIGIGTGTPQKKLHLLENASIADIRLERGLGGEYWDIGGTGLFLNLSYMGTDLFTFAADGNFGVGTDSPERKIHVSGSNPRVLIEDTGASNPEVNFKRASADNTWAIYMDSGTNDLRFYNAGTHSLVMEDLTGYVGIGATNPSYLVDVDGPVMLRGQSGDPGTGNPWAGIYAKPTGNSELWCIDGVGNTKQLSPHDPETGEWIFYSKNIKTGRVVRVDMEKMVRYLDELTGEDFLREWNEPVEAQGVRNYAPGKSPESHQTASRETTTIPALLQRIRTLEDKIAALEVQGK